MASCALPTLLGMFDSSTQPSNPWFSQSKFSPEDVDELWCRAKRRRQGTHDWCYPSEDAASHTSSSCDLWQSLDDNLLANVFDCLVRNWMLSESRNARLVCKAWRNAHDSRVTALTPKMLCLEMLCSGRFASLTALDLQQVLSATFVELVPCINHPKVLGLNSSPLWQPQLQSHL